jgi:hypothetical protein
MLLSPTSSSGSEYEEMRGRRILEKRMRRRSWYEYFLAKYTHVIKEEDLVMDNESDSNDQDSLSATKLVVIERDGVSMKFDGTCCICLDEYAPGDKVVFSPLEDCKHVFCWECKMTWLEKGKKRCPVCRAWFVPGAAISDQISADIGEDSSSPLGSLGASLDLDRDEDSREISV